MQQLNILIASAIILFTTTSLFAQDAAVSLEDELATTLPATTEEEEEEESFSFSGMVDAYYQANLISDDNDDPLIFPTSFTGQANQFGIGMVNLLAEKELGKVSFIGQIGFGPRAVAANSDSNGPAGTNFASTVQQLFVTYSPSELVTFTLGNFGTFVGYEVIDAAANMNYSTSYLFSNGPFYHTGFKADFALGEQFGAMVGIFNDTDSKFDAISGKHYGAQLSAEIGELSAYLNFITGKDVDGIDPDESDDDVFETQIDLTATYAASENLSFGLNASSYSTSLDGDSAGGFIGTALYSTIGISDAAAVSLRAEYFSATAIKDDDTDQPSVIALTASGNFTVGDLLIIPEFRFDTGNNGFLFGETEDDNSAASFIMAAVYSF
ncbi:hypothetical protein CEQ90_05435 [Lewinellaceae bacterium SD302]|nr:hypothetical protein CEQ90_05435 [Lewinellaceae bacterium SD302]